MENRNARTFVTIVECGSFTKAAESMGYSQAAVTAQIKALEKELAVPLFDRIGKKVVLTQEGERFLPHAINMLKAEDEAISSVRQKDNLTGDLRICAPSSYASNVLPELLMSFHGAHPDVNITVRVFDFIEEATDKLRKGEIDFLIKVDEEDADGEFAVAADRAERVVFVTHPDNPLAGKKNLRIEDVVQNQFIASGRHVGYVAMLDRELKRRGIEMKAELDIGSVGAVVRILLGGYGMSYIPEYIASEYIERGELAELKIRGVDINLHSYFEYNRNRWLNPVMQEFIRMAESMR